MHTIRFHQAKYLLSAHTIRQIPPDQGAEVVFAGRSNSGKSSVINTLTRQKALAKTGKTPGRTRQINFFGLGNGLRLVDLPGYGYAKAPGSIKKHWYGVIDAYLATRKCLMGLVLIADIRRGITDLDARLLDWSRTYGLPVHVLLNKTDKLSRGAAAAALRGTAQELVKSDLSHVTLQLFSAVKKTGVEELEERLSAWLLQS